MRTVCTIYYHEVVLYGVWSCWDWCCEHLTLYCAPFSSLSQVNGSVLVEGVMRIYWGLTKTITVAGGDQMYVGRQQGGYTKQEDLPDQWRREVRDIQEQRISRYLELVRMYLVCAYVRAYVRMYTCLCVSVTLLLKGLIGTDRFLTWKLYMCVLCVAIINTYTI